MAASRAGDKPAERRVYVVDCPVDRVTVFTTQADVVRRVPVAEAVGAVCLRMCGFTQNINEQSVRVHVRGADGQPQPAIEIQDVAFETRLVSEAEVAMMQQGASAVAASTREQHEREQRLVQLDADLTRLEREQRAVAARLERFRAARSLLSGYVQGMLMRSAGTDVGVLQGDGMGPCAPAIATANAGPSLTELLGFHSERDTALERSERAAATEHERAAQRIAQLRALQQQLREALGGAQSTAQRRTESREATVLFHAATLTSFELLVTYTVDKAGWGASYDVRIGSEGGGSMALTYFGLVRQGTGEDWSDAEVRLSTAVPWSRGSPPEMLRKCARDSPQIVRPEDRGYFMNADWELDPSKRQADLVLFEEESRACLQECGFGLDFDAPPPPAKVAVASVESAGMGPATFIVNRRATIPSDNKPHKLTIAIIELQPQMLHYCAPAAEPSAFLQARARNTSEYPLLPSEKVAVYFDGSFITTTRMMLVSAGEAFNTFLGQDPAVRVDYRPLQTTVRRASGLFSRKDVTTFEQMTVVTNNKQTTVRLVLVDVLPRTSTDELSVELVTPRAAELVRNAARIGDDFALSCERDADVVGELMARERELPTETVLQNVLTHNMVWVRTLAPGARVQIPFVFTVSVPKRGAFQLESC